MDDREQRAHRIKRRNRALLAVLLSLVVLFYVVSMVRIGGM